MSNIKRERASLNKTLAVVVMMMAVGDRNSTELLFSDSKDVGIIVLNLLGCGVPHH